MHPSDKAAVGVAEKYPLPAIIIDLGTATKITVVTEDHSYIGGAILPGVAISLSALSGSTSLLPSIGLGAGKIKTIGSNTVDCMISGVVLGFACMLDGMIERYREELGEVPTVVACGGLASTIVPHCKSDIILDKDLLLVAKDDELGRKLQDLDLPVRKRAPRKE